MHVSYDLMLNKEILGKGFGGDFKIIFEIHASALATEPISGIRASFLGLNHRLIVYMHICLFVCHGLGFFN